jgi:predicted regulator of Ras-like GTPase activity (Roadblock/LC7/MglB family)
MIVTPRNTLLILFGVAIVFLIPFFAMRTPQEMIFSPLLVPLVVLFEVILYFIYISFRRETIEIVPYIVLAVLVVLFRFAASLLGAFFLAVQAQGHLGNDLLQLWIGRPVSVLLQIAVIMLLLPHVVALTAPGMLVKDDREKLSKESLSVEESESVSAFALVSEATPLGGFVRTYDFTELQDYFRKVVGLEGFVLTNDEGLIIWQDLQIRLDIDTLVVRYQLFDREMGRLTKQFGLQKLYRWVLQTREHFICYVALGSTFSLLLFFNTQLSLAEIASKLDMLVRTVLELLNTRYGATWVA